MYDVVIIGAGVCGCAVARELARYDVKACVIEREEDVCCGTSKANSGIVHAGYDAVPGSWKARMNRRGNEMMGELAAKLDIPFERCGSFVICKDEDGMGKLQELYDRGLENEIEGLEILDAGQVREMEPNVTEGVFAALYAPTAGIVCPFELNIALAENAYVNGVPFYFDTDVEKITKVGNGYSVKTNNGVFEGVNVVNAAGVYADVLHNMVSVEKIHITPRKGEYCLLDKTAGGHVGHTVFALPDEYGKGILVTPTVHGNLMIGPTASDMEDKEDISTEQAGLEKVMSGSGSNVECIPYRKVITSFAGLRAHENGGDFIIGEVADAPGFIDCAGIESPGLTSAPAIGEMIAGMLAEKLKLVKKNDFQEVREGIPHLAELSIREQNELIKRDASYGKIVCRCEKVTEGEIINAVRRPLGARSLDGIKRRTRAGMGRCQQGFCAPKVIEILSRELGIPMDQVSKSGKGSEFITGMNKGGLS